VALAARKKRELIFEVLFSFEWGEGEDPELILFLMKEHKISKKNALEIISQAKKINALKVEIDKMISSVCHSYEVKRIETVERVTLRLAFFELLYEKNIPCEVIISEAKRLSRKFATKEAASFVHGIIDAANKIGK
jgi:transcription antitermination protein NusB